MDTPFSVGFFETDITPELGAHLIGGFGPRPAAGILDPLHAKAIVVDNGQARAALVTVDVCLIQRPHLDAVKERIARRTGIPPECVLISATHTHTGPAAAAVLAVDRDDAYLEMAVPRIADAVECAAQRLEPCELRIGTGEVDQVFNRRWHMKDGSVRMNPGYEHPDLVRPAGPVDRELGVLSFRSPAGDPLAMYVNYSLHYVGSAPSNWVSADYFARVDNNLRRMTGVGLGILSNGTCGDVNNCDYSSPAPQVSAPNGRAIQVAAIVAAEAARVYYESPLSLESVISGRLVEVPVTRRSLDPEQLARDAQVVAAMDRMRPNAEQVYALERLELAQEPLEQRTWVQALRIGDALLVGLPGELFVELGVEVKARSPFPHTFCVELANDWVGYVPTPKGLAEGSYECETARSSKLTAEAGPDMVEAALKLAQELLQE